MSSGDDRHYCETAAGYTTTKTGLRNTYAAQAAVLSPPSLRSTGSFEAQSLPEKDD